MRQVVRNIFNDKSENLLFKIASIFAILIAANVAVWCWALAVFDRYPVLLGTAMLAYGFGLRHAVDADHIAAIDNVIRKLMQEGKRPAAVGLFFSLGHSTVVILACFAIALTSVAFKDKLEALQDMGGVIGTSVSALFLLAVALMNLGILINLCRNFRKLASGGCYQDEALNTLLTGRGFFARIFRPLFRIIGHSWHMYFLGFLFGLGFDTATEIGLLGISAAEAAKGMSVWSIMVFPALFTVGMSLVDTADSILMLGAYGWAFIKPQRKLYYNMTITFVSMVVALLIGGIETLGIIGDQLVFKNSFWQGVGVLNNHFGVIGFLIIALFAVTWIGSAVFYRVRGYDHLNINISEAA